MRPSEPRRKVAAVCWAAVTAVLAATTFFTSANPYGSPWFIAMMAAAGAGIAWSVVKGIISGSRTAGDLILHAGLLVILIGGGVTAFTGERGTLILAPGAPAATHWLLDDGSATRPLPEPIALDSFVIDRCAALAAPAGFTSYLTTGADGAKAVVSVNHPLRIGSIRFYQSSYGADGSSVLGIDHDPRHGREVSYAGYILLMAGFALCLLRRFRSQRRLTGTVALTLIALSAYASPRGLSAETSDSLDTLQVLYQGRVAPFPTVASELMKSLAGDEAPSARKGRVIAASIPLFPDDWAGVPLILVDDPDLRKALAMPDGEVLIAPSALYAPDGSYRLAELFHGTDKGLDRSIILVDSRLETFNRAAAGELWQALPAGAERLSAPRVAAERFYMSVPMRRISFMALLAAGVVALLCALFMPGVRAASTGVTVFFGAIALWQICGMILRWVISGIAPMTSGSDALSLVSLMLTVAAIALWLRHRKLTSSLTALTGGFAALVAWLGQPSSAIVPVMPVLASPWLAVHVTLVMSAYALLTVTFIIAAIDIFRPDSRRQASVRDILLPALALLAAGICTGAVWAGDSWGRYWAWDPKETWALITLLVYAAPLHFAMRGRRFDIFILAAFLTVVMTYWGVNFLPSLHAYQ